MTLVVDASVAIKWVVKEADSGAALSLLQAEDLIAPDLLVLECASVLSREARRKRLPPDRAVASLREIRRANVRLLPSAALVTEAQRLSLQLNAAVYDCLYLAVALAEGAPVVTADARFFNAVAAQPAHAPYARRL